MDNTNSPPNLGIITVNPNDPKYLCYNKHGCSGIALPSGEAAFLNNPITCSSTRKNVIRLRLFRKNNLLLKTSEYLVGPKYPDL